MSFTAPVTIDNGGCVHRVDATIVRFGVLNARVGTANATIHFPLPLPGPIKIEIGSDAGDAERVTTASGAVLMKKIRVQHEALFVWPLHAERILVFVP